MELWIVKVACYYSEECYRDALETDVTVCKTEKAAVNALEEIIRDDWTAEVCIDGGVKSLADCRGMSENGEFSKHSSWYYSEDGKKVWFFGSTGSGYKGEVVKLEVPS